jgi:Mlc titration factor MtfA (ptsG expression regulator)
MLTVKIVIASIGLVVIFLIAKILSRQAKRKHLLSMPFPDEWIKIIENNVPLYNRIPETLKKQLHGLINIFLTEKNFEGCGGLEITDEIKITIAAQACMLLLNRNTSYFRKLHTIYVYPHTYIAKTISSNGRITIEGQDARLGESWQNGPVVLAWDSVKGGTSNIYDARNVVIHEFAHQLDQEDGSADGAPILEKRARYVTWARVLSKEYETLQRKKKKHRRSILNKYGATNPAEFFAVATETFFEKPKQMKKKHKELYDEMRNYYRLDPAEWMQTK